MGKRENENELKVDPKYWILNMYWLDEWRGVICDAEVATTTTKQKTREHGHEIIILICVSQQLHELWIALEMEGIWFHRIDQRFFALLLLLANHSIWNTRLNIQTQGTCMNSIVDIVHVYRARTHTHAWACSFGIFLRNSQ